jgi:hypothetical protein
VREAEQPQAAIAPRPAVRQPRGTPDSRRRHHRLPTASGTRASVRSDRPFGAVRV